MDLRFLKIGSLIFAICYIICSGVTAEQDEISPGTLPDEIPNPSTFRRPENPANDLRDTASSNIQDVDSDDGTPSLMVEKPQPRPTKFVKSPQEERDEELAKPDPSYHPSPQKKAEQKSSEAASDTKALERIKPTEPKSAPESEPPSEHPVQSQVASQAPPAPPPKELARPPKRQPVPLVLNPEILAMMESDLTHTIPVETFITRFAVPKTQPSRPAAGVSDFSIILSNNEFYPSRVVLKSGSSFRLLFTTTNRKSAALVIEKIHVQRWISSEEDKTKELDRSRFELNREISANRVTIIDFDAKPGVYGFHDVITGASGEITVEEP
jgi:Cupredoxin-like domain